MKKTHTVRTFLAGVLVTLLVVAMIPSALAAAGMNIYIYPGISVYIDDQKLEPKDANGSPVMVFTYNGTTYLPVRAVSEALGKPVQWEGATNSVYVGKHTGGEPAAWLAGMDYFSGDSSIARASSEQDNMGQTHYHCITKSFERTYIINDKYSRLTGTLYQTYDCRSQSIGFGSRAGLWIYGDGELLFKLTYADYSTGIRPAEINVNLSGVKELKIVMEDGQNSNYSSSRGNILSLGDVGLWT